MGRPGLYSIIDKKKKRIQAGSSERVRSPGSAGAPTAAAFRAAAETAKPAKSKVTRKRYT